MSEHSSVTVIGLGPMGRAIVRELLAAGTEVTVWNRSTDKAEAMAAAGAHRAGSVAEALDRNQVIILSLTHYAAMYDVLGQAPERLRDKVIVNLYSDSRSGRGPVRAGCGRTVRSSCRADSCPPATTSPIRPRTSSSAVRARSSMPGWTCSGRSARRNTSVPTLSERLRGAR